MFESTRHEMDNGTDPLDVDTAKQALEDHNMCKKRITKAPVEQMDLEGQQVRYLLLKLQ